MFLITGWSNERKVVLQGQAPCDNCRSIQLCIRIAERRWFRLFFIPLFPISSAREYLQCQRCGSTMGLETIGNSPLARPIQTVSSAAVAGFVFSILAFFAVCIFILSIPLSLGAILFGHLGLAAVRRGKPYVSGRWQALTALAVGYPVLLMSLGIAAWFTFIVIKADSLGDVENRNAISKVDTSYDSPTERLRSAEMQVATHGGNLIGRGNSPEAEALAQEYAESLQQVNKVAFTEGKKRLLSTSQGEFLTYCELHEDRCLFIVHVPGYRDYESEAKEYLAKIAWSLAEATVKDKLKSGNALGVGLRGTLLYGDIFVGTVSSDETAHYRQASKSDLLSFFPNPEEFKTDSSRESVAKDRAQNIDSLDSSSKDNLGNQISDFTAFDSTNAPPPTAPNRQLERSSEEQGKPNQGSVSSTTPKTNPVDSAKPKVTKEPRKKPDLPTFQNRIAIRKKQYLENKMWAYQSLAFSDDGKWLAAGKMDGAAELLDAESGQLISRVDKLHDMSSISQLAFTQDRKALILGGSSGVSRIYSISESGEITNPLDLNHHRKEITHLQVSRKYGFAILGSRDGTLSWQPVDERKNTTRFLNDFKKEIKDVWLPQNGTEALATDGTMILKFSLKDASVVERMESKKRSGKIAIFSPDGNWLVSDENTSLNIWNLKSPSDDKTIKLGRSESVYSLAIHPNGRWLAAGTRGKVLIWDFQSEEKLAEINCESIHYVQSLVFSNDGAMLATCTRVAQQGILIFEIGSDVR